ncbi:MAG: ATP phosphoribosyltransferase [Gammaproteobacteria bacterium]|nr:ATP phosphoribosyltransferase [Gammaproteobacteria bacterium]NIM71629.1 ATP phosphoribosyltransferase [Gammaproteobacteria bacterium]NIO23369.1 ATP phosphoribosyltransferase [Gammaproteobacteria bacterium]NIO63997.1 ATP phosphoribosyltransferase [Gammaproteobacteria bacterium]NIP47116.1 ATP phosphoribosyltransferase [Gammaproteobacteria bacterium]
MLTIAISKGRIYREALPLLDAAGIRPNDDPDTSRKLLLDTNLADVRLLVLRARDVPTFVEHGAADAGIAGKDVLLEHGGGGLYEPLDLGIARCRMVVAARRGCESLPRRPRVATKYVVSTRRYFAQKSVQAEIIELYGSMELAPLVGLADCIVDLVDTGGTLAANDLVEVGDVCPISSRLVVNRASMKMKHERMKAFIDSLADAVSNVSAQGAGRARAS